VCVCVRAAQVGNAFVNQYYNILHQSPELVHRFYQDASRLGRPAGAGADGMDTVTTMDVSFLAPPPRPLSPRPRSGLNSHLEVWGFFGWWRAPLISDSAGD
jgi:hypothetical protein